MNKFKRTSKSQSEQSNDVDFEDLILKSFVKAVIEVNERREQKLDQIISDLQLIKEKMGITDNLTEE